MIKDEVGAETARGLGPSHTAQHEPDVMATIEEPCMMN